MPDSEPTLATTDNVGEATYKAVNELTSRRDNPLTRAEAFSQLAREQGRKEGTVSANYYRVARKRGEGRRPARAPRVRAAAKLKRQSSPLLDAIARARVALDEVERAARDDLQVRQQLRSLL